MAFNYGGIISGLAGRYGGTDTTGGAGNALGGTFASWGRGVASSSGLWSNVGSWMSGLFSGGGSSNSGGVNWGQALLGGLGSAADAYMGNKMDEKAVARAGFEQRKSTAFAAELEDFYKQKGKQRKRVALDTYGQFSTTNRFAPNMVASPAIDVPTKPNPGA